MRLRLNHDMPNEAVYDLLSYEVLALVTVLMEPAVGLPVFLLS